MISLVNSVFITLLFSVWIWTLKQDIEQLRRPAHDGPDMDLAPENVTPKSKPPMRHSSSALYDQNGKERGNSGVATWTIA